MEMHKLEHFNHLEKRHIPLLGLISDAMAQIEGKHLDNVCWDINVGSEVMLFVEPALFQCVLRNLLDNAAKYARPNSVVRVVYSAMITQNRLTITNQFLDNSKPEIKRLGERFFRHAAHQDIAGSGLGLSIVRKVVELHRMHLAWHISDDNCFSVVLEIPENVV